MRSNIEGAVIKGVQWGVPSSGNLGGMPRWPVTSVTAIGTTQANASQLSYGFNLVAGADATVGVRLPLAETGQVVVIKNNAGAILKVWPAVGDQINAVTIDAHYPLAALTSLILVAVNATTWMSIPLVGS